MGRFRIALAALWLFGSIGGVGYAWWMGFPLTTALLVLPAMLVELSLYASLAFPAVRERWAALGDRLPVWMFLSVLLPYGLYCPAGQFQWQSLVLLATLAGILCWWYVLLPRHVAVDLAFLVFVAGAYLAKPFQGIYPPPLEGLRVDVLGQLAWIRTGIMATLLIREIQNTGFGFIPKRKEWLIGVKQYIYFMPFGVALMYGLGFARFDPAPGWWWKWVGTFIGILWVVALAEELLFRGLLQQELSRRYGSVTGLAVASVVFGAAHLSFGEFPNWEFATMAAVAGWFYGRAFQQGHGIRAAMVAHALTVATWRTLFR